MSIESELLSPYDLIHPEKTTFRLKPPHRAGKNPSLESTQYQLYRESWSETNSKIAKIFDDLQSGLLQDLITFIKTTKFNLQSLIRQPIPTAVILGASKVLNASLAIKINAIRNPSGEKEYIPIQLSSRTCLTTSSSIKSIVNSLENQLSNFVEHQNSYNSHDEHTKTTGPSNELATDDLENIRALYVEFLRRSSQSSYTNGPSPPIHTATEPSAGTKTLTLGPKLLFLIDDFEGFDSFVLEDLITIFSNFLHGKIPIILVLSINTSADAIQSLLPRTVVLKLKMTPFAVDMSGGAVTSLIHRISLDPESRFDLSTGVIRSLMEGYDRLNKSIDALISKLKFIHLAHFHTNPLVQLFDSTRILDVSEGQTEEDGMARDDERLIILDGVTNKIEYVTHHLRLTTSWKKHSGNLSKQPLNTLLPQDNGGLHKAEDDKEMINLLIKSYKSKKLSRNLTGLALETLFGISHFWPEKERTHEWVLYNIFRPELIDYSAQLCNLIKHSNDEMVMNILNSISEVLSANPEFEWIEGCLVKLSALITDDQFRKINGRSHLINTHEPVLPGTKLLQADHDFSQILSDTYDALVNFFRKHLGPDSLLLELNEAWTFDDKILLNQVFHPKYTHQIKTGLELNKGLVGLNQNGEEARDDKLGGNEIDRIQQMYELYMETNGKMINLNDWYGAFFQQSTTQKSEQPEPNHHQATKDQKRTLKKNNKQPDQAIQARKNIKNNEIELEKSFLKSIADLGFLGMISPCTRRKEHVSKNFFG